MLKKKQIEATATWLIKIAITSSWKFWLFISLKRAAAVFGLLSWCSVPVILNELKKNLKEDKVFISILISVVSCQ